ncbi:MAG: hypothetical protein R3E89_03170 [Thiolinea sp.]
MKILNPLVYTVLGGSLLLSTALPLAAADSDSDATTTSRWNLGLEATLSASPFVGGESRWKFSPVRLNSDGFTVSGPSLVLYQQPRWRLFTAIGTDELDYERNDSPQLRDMDELERAINLRLGVAWKSDQGCDAGAGGPRCGRCPSGLAG